MSLFFLAFEVSRPVAIYLEGAKVNKAQQFAKMIRLDNVGSKPTFEFRINPKEFVINLDSQKDFMVVVF